MTDAVTMFDSTVAGNIPENAQAAAGYVDGNWPSYDAIVARTPHAAHISITVRGAAGARVLDWERGNANPPQWAGDEIHAGRRPTIYCSRSSIPIVGQAIGPLEFGHDVDLWCADWTGQAHEYPGAVATQYANDVNGCDESLALLSWLVGGGPPGPINPDPVDTGVHYVALVPGYGIPGTPELAVIGQMLGPGIYRGRNVAGGQAVYAGTGDPTTWATGFAAGKLPAGTPLAVLEVDAYAVSTVVTTEAL